MKSLKTSFIGKGEVKGFLFSQISHTNRAFLYKVSTGFTVQYEVFQKRINTQYDCVSYPRSKSFGLWAWTYRNQESAINKFNQLNDRLN